MYVLITLGTSKRTEIPKRHWHRLTLHLHGLKNALTGSYKYILVRHLRSYKTVKVGTDKTVKGLTIPSKMYLLTL